MELDSNFTVTDSMRGELLAGLRERGVEIDAADWDMASELIDSQFGLELARYVFGRDVESQRRTAEDPDVVQAVEFLSAVSSQEELFVLAGSNQLEPDLLMEKQRP